MCSFHNDAYRNLMPLFSLIISRNHLESINILDADVTCHPRGPPLSKCVIRVLNSRGLRKREINSRPGGLRGLGLIHDEEKI